MIIDNPFEICRRGTTLPAEQVAHWRERLQRAPDDREARLVLLGATEGAERYSHALYLIETEPTWWLMGRSTIPSGRPEYERGCALFRAAVERHDDPQVALNAARFVLLFEPERGFVFFELAEQRHGRARPLLLALATYVDEVLTLSTAQGDAPSPALASRAMRLHKTLLLTDTASEVQARVRAVVRFARLGSEGRLAPQLEHFVPLSSRRDLSVAEIEEMRSRFSSALDDLEARRE